MTTIDLHGRQAIEALRAGVPNRDAVAVLGSGQPRIESKFLEALDLAQDDLPNARQTPGLLIAGGFGSGKSHLLEHLQHLALQQNFICSKVVISKETPLFDPARFYRAAIRAAVVPKRTGDALTEVAFSLKFDTPDVAALNG
jgi:BREX system ATP-binding protein BrxC/D